MNFTDLGLIDPILKALNEEGYKQPTPIQAQAIPHVLKQRDLLGCAQTGTGKTAAFAIPMLQLLTQKRPAQGQKQIRALILTPTRELAIQIEESFAAYGRHCPVSRTVIFGGVSQHAQTTALKRGSEVLVATPGRLLDLIQQGFVDLKRIEIFVLDEADRMLDMGFIHDVKRVIQLLPKERQTLFFSATMPPEIKKLSASILHDPARVEVTPPATTAQTIAQQLYFVEKAGKRQLLNELLKGKDIDRVLVFTRTKHGANRVAKDLIKEGITAEAIHGNKSQTARQAALKNFKSKSTRVLVATDIAARGIDVDDLLYVINYEMPNVPETYVHRIGRTGRAGASGTAISFCDQEERAYLKDIQKLIGIQIPAMNADNMGDAPEVKTEQRGQGQRGNQQSRQPKGERSGNGQRRPQQRKQNATEQKPKADGNKQTNSKNEGQPRSGNRPNSVNRPQGGNRPNNHSGNAPRNGETKDGQTGGGNRGGKKRYPSRNQERPQGERHAQPTERSVAEKPKNDAPKEKLSEDQKKKNWLARFFKK